MEENKTCVLLEKENRRLSLFYKKESYTKQLLGLSNLIYLFLTQKKIKLIIKCISLLLKKNTLTLSEYVVWKTKIA